MIMTSASEHAESRHACRDENVMIIAMGTPDSGRTAADQPVTLLAPSSRWLV
jgi:hypothetical protein